VIARECWLRKGENLNHRLRKGKVSSARKEVAVYQLNSFAHKEGEKERFYELWGGKVRRS